MFFRKSWFESVRGDGAQHFRSAGDEASRPLAELPGEGVSTAGWPKLSAGCWGTPLFGSLAQSESTF